MRTLTLSTITLLALCPALPAQELADEEEPCSYFIDVRIGPDGMGQMGIPTMVNGVYQVNWHYTGIAREDIETIIGLMDGSSEVSCETFGEILDVIRGGEGEEPGPAKPVGTVEEPGPTIEEGGGGGAGGDPVGGPGADGVDYGEDVFGDPLTGPPFKWGKSRFDTEPPYKPWKGPNGFNGYGVNAAWAAANGIEEAPPITPGGYWEDNVWTSYSDASATLAFHLNNVAAAQALYIMAEDENFWTEVGWETAGVLSAAGSIYSGVRKISQAAIGRAAKALSITEAQAGAALVHGTEVICKSQNNSLIRSFVEDVVIGEGNTARDQLDKAGEALEQANGDLYDYSQEVNDMPDPDVVRDIAADLTNSGHDR